MVVANGHMETVKALVPQAEMLAYAPSLNSMTGGRGSYLMEYAQYEEVPKELVGRIIEEHKAGRHAASVH
jgi:elongation factor G